MKALKTVLVAAALAVMTAAPALAQDLPTMYLHTKAGEKIGFNFADRPTISFNRANALIIKSQTTSAMVKGFTTVHKITFSDAAGISDIEADAQGVISTEEGRVVTLAGFADGTVATVTNLAGQVLKSVVLPAEGETRISLASYGKGVYIIAAGDVVCKIAIN